MIAIYGIIGAVVILLFWGLILWLAAKADKPYLDAQDPQRAKQIFGDDGVGELDGASTEIER